MIEVLPQSEILVVDDDEATAIYLAGLLRREGYGVVTAACGAEALELAQARDPHLILLDVMLPDVDGFSLCRELKSMDATARIPVIFLTAKGGEPEVLRGFEAGGVDYVVKPFAVAVLLARVATQCALSRLSRGLHAALDERGERLQQANRRLRELNIEMATVEERQRRQLAQQLHDTTIQELVLARILLEGATDLDARRQQLLELLIRAVGQLRSLVFELSPPLLRGGGLYPALQWLADEVHNQWGLNVQCEQVGELPDLSDALAVTLFQGTRELLINAAKHADATRALVRVACTDETLSISVSDDGRGFDPHRLDDAAAILMPGAGGGFGLDSLRSRIELLGGHLQLGNGAGGGAEAVLSIALAAALLEQPRS